LGPATLASIEGTSLPADRIGCPSKGCGFVATQLPLEVDGVASHGATGICPNHTIEACQSSRDQGERTRLLAIWLLVNTTQGGVT
jgi:hypothetical protein